MIYLGSLVLVIGGARYFIGIADKETSKLIKKLKIRKDEVRKDEYLGYF